MFLLGLWYYFGSSLRLFVFVSSFLWSPLSPFLRVSVHAGIRYRSQWFWCSCAVRMMVPLFEQSWCDISGWSCAEGWGEEHAHRQEYRAGRGTTSLKAGTQSLLARIASIARMCYSSRRQRTVSVVGVPGPTFLLLVFMAAHLLQFPFAGTKQYCLLTLTCFKSWDQELSPDLMLEFMAVHFFQFRFAVAGRYWHPSWLFTRHSSGLLHMALSMEEREGIRSLRLLCLSCNRGFGFSTTCLRILKTS